MLPACFLAREAKTAGFHTGMIPKVLRDSLRLTILSALVLGGLRAQPQAPFTPLDPFVQTKLMGRGVNVLGYDPLWQDRSKARFQDRHFKLIHDAGFQTLRVNLQAFRHMNEANRLSDAWFQTLDWIVKGGLDNHLQVILDEHDFGTCGTNAAPCKVKLLAFWDQMAAHYKNAPSAVTFEILNEPNGQFTAEVWNDFFPQALAIIRKTNPTRNVIVGPASWNNIHALDQLRLPGDDRHIISTVHYYLPMRFTHQGAPWNKDTANLSGIPWGTATEKAAIDSDFAGVQKWSQEQKRPILLGEFGAYDKGEMESRVLYTSGVARTAEKLGWAWAYWQFDSDFIVWSMEKNAWVQPILKALIP